MKVCEEIALSNWLVDLFFCPQNSSTLQCPNTVGFWCQAILKKFLRRFDTSFDMKIYAMEIIFKYREPFRDTYHPIQPKRLVWPGQLAGNSERARGVLKIILMAYILTIIFMSKLVSNLRKIFYCIAWH